MTEPAHAPSCALVVVAHPDDCDFGCGGTVAKWSDAGARIGLVVLTDGSKGSHDPEPSDAALRDAREREQRAASEILGVADVLFMRQPDGELAETPALIAELAAVVREVKPEVVITHDPWRRYELHPDHTNAGRITLAALYAAREPRAARALAERGLAPWRPRELLLAHPEEPDRFEDIGATLERKLQALLCHRSQYATTFGIHDGQTSPFRARVHGWAVSLSPWPGIPCEHFRALPLPLWPA